MRAWPACRAAAGAAAAALALTAGGAVSLEAQAATRTQDAPGRTTEVFAGRWSLVLTDGLPPRVLGELRLRETGQGLAGTIYLATHDSVPLPLADIQVQGDRIEFLAGLDPSMRFVGRLRRDELTGEAFGGAGEQIQRWTASRIASAIEYYAALPRFTLRQIITGRGDSVLVTPGPWLAAAAAAGQIADSAYPAYARAAAAAGLAPLPPEQLVSDAAPYLLGVHRRDEVRAVLVGTLQQMRAALPTAQLRTVFDRLFRTRSGAWVADLHDFAFARAQIAAPALEWRHTRAALTAAAWLAEDAPDADHVYAHALYRLARLEAVDSAEFARVSGRMQSDRAAARAVRILLDGYAAAGEWYPEAMEFLVSAPLVQVDRPGVGPQSVGGLLSAFWETGRSRPELDVRWFGYPQAVPRYGVSDAFFRRLVSPENWAAHEWLRRHRPARALAVMQRLGAEGPPPAATIERHGRTLGVTTVRQQAAMSSNGFLEPEDRVLLDPGVPPLLAIGTLVHEWQHIEFERLRWSMPGAAPAMFDSATATVTLRPADPLIAEGYAEWSAARILAPAAAQYPVLGLTEPLKRARLARHTPDDPHLIGYLLVRTLAETVPASEMAPLLAGASVDPTRVLEAPVVGRAWRRFADAPDAVQPVVPSMTLIPETTFTIEGGLPDVVGTRIRF